jgi:tRNA(Ile)-lysidine synthase
MLENSSLQLLKGKKNLLAFSAGGDSTALFFLLLKFNIKFDIAIVNYNTREQSLNELVYAQELALKHKLLCHTLNAPKIEKNFESKAREIRYNFFQTLITEFTYENLLTAHHLGDRFEWMLMQFCKGAGCAELSGMQLEDKRASYSLIRPLLHLEKEELLIFLKKEKILYFEDETNADESIQRNHVRHRYTKPLLKQYLNGIKKSFEYLDEDRALLIQEAQVYTVGKLIYFKRGTSKRSDIYTVDKELKKLGFMMSASEKEFLKAKTTLTLGRKYIVNFDINYVFIIPDSKQKVEMSHKFKEVCRVLKIEPKLRSFFYLNTPEFIKIKELLLEQ